MKAAIIGSGQAALSTAEALIERGVKPVILDVGETLPERLRSKVRHLAEADPHHWSGDDAAFDEAPQSGPLPRKTVFGSDYLYAQDRPFAPVRLDGARAYPTFAKGGFSMGWGGAVLPARPEDLDAWPIAHDALEPHYAKAAQSMPLCANDDRLSEAFPIHHPSPQPAAMTDQGRRLLADLEDAAERLNQGRDRALFGAARLAVDQATCKSCGLCLTGCPYGCIHTLDGDLERLVTSGSVDYAPNAYVVAVEETPKGTQVRWIDTQSGAYESQMFERVFIGAGVLSTARIVLNSLNVLDQDVTVIDSAKFAIPMARLPGATFDWPHTNTLADLFLEAVLEEVAPNWLHVQVSPLNELIIDKLAMRAAHDPRALNALGRMAKPLLSRLMVAWCGMHSNLSDDCRISVSKGQDDLPVLSVKTGTARTEGYAKAYGRALAKKGRLFKSLFVPQAMLTSPPCSTGHCGGTFPMRENPQGPLEADVLGRVGGWKNVHLVDASTFPSIPGTTIALLIRANARRIVAELDLEDRA